MRKLLCTITLAVCMLQAGAQTLFTYGKKSVSREEFVKNFLKNNANLGGDRTASLKENLELYIRYKLKVQAAYDMKYDTLSSQKEELLNFRRQIENNYLKEDKSFNMMVDEAFKRMQKDIHLGHIMINLYTPDKKMDSALALRRISEALKKIKAGGDFAKIAAEYSDDPSAKENGGDLGYITVFTLPYEMENLIYNTAPGKISSVYKSGAAYHIFKNMGERPAMGKMKAAQILLAFAPNTSEAQKQALAKQANDLYEQLKKGEPFENLARAYSNDYVSAQSGGVMAEFGAGKYDPVFESAIYNLAKDGDFSKPFTTAYGYHIVKRLGREPVSSDNKDLQARQVLADQVRTDARNEQVKEMFVKTILKPIGYKEAPLDRRKLVTITDSILAGNVSQDKQITDKTLLHSFAKQKVMVGDFWKFCKAAKSGNFFKNKNTEGLLKEYLKATAIEYYRDHLDEYDAAFKSQLMEFKDGNLLFEAMGKQVWNKAAEDSAGLRKFYTAHKQQYKWDRSAEAVIFNLPDLKTAQELSEKIKRNPYAWRDTILNYPNAQADSSRYLLSDIPVADRTAFADKMCTTPFVVGNDGSASFTYVFKVYEAGGVRSFEDARGMTINDYQQQLEEEWIAKLKKQYPVTVNQPVWADILKKGQ